MKTAYTLADWMKDGERQFRSPHARRIAGIENRQTWNNYLASVGLPPGEHEPVLTMSDLVWIWTLKRWLGLNRRKSRESTHQVFRHLKQTKGWTLDQFLQYMETDLASIVHEISRRINLSNQLWS